MPNSEVWLYAGGGGTLISAATSVVLAIIRGQTKLKMEALRIATPDDAPRIIADLVTMYRLDTSNWPSDHQKELALTEIGFRNARSKRSMIIAIAGMFLFAVVTMAALLRSTSDEHTEGKPTMIIDRKVK